MTRTWREHEELLARFGGWLAQTEAEADALAAWDATGESGAAAAEPQSETGLLQIVEALTAVRHEVKLETRSNRGLQDDVRAALAGLETARQRFDSAGPREQEAAHRAALPFVEALAGLDEALWRGASAFEAAHLQMTQQTPQQLRQALDERFGRLPWWRRWLVGGWQREVQQQWADALAATNEMEFGGLMDGFRLIRARLERTLAQQGIRRIECVGRPVDPARMSVVELVRDSTAMPETVVEEVRPGYVWGDRVIRFAEVRATRGAPAPPVAPERPAAAVEADDDDDEDDDEDCVRTPSEAEVRGFGFPDRQMTR